MLYNKVLPFLLRIYHNAQILMVIEEWRGLWNPF